MKFDVGFFDMFTFLVRMLGIFRHLTKHVTIQTPSRFLITHMFQSRSELL